MNNNNAVGNSGRHASGPPKLTGERTVFTFVSEAEFGLIKWCNTREGRRGGGGMAAWLKGKIMAAAFEVVRQELASGKPVDASLVQLYDELRQSSKEKQG